MARIAFHPAPGVNVSDADALITEVIDPKTFYSVAPPKKTGTMPTVALAPDSSAYPAGYHAGDVGGLPAVDGDLVAGNIKDGVTIFDVLGTFANTLAEDIKGNAATALTTSDAGTYFRWLTIAWPGPTDLVSKTQDYDASSLAIAFGVITGRASSANVIKIQLVMDGVEVAESAWITNVTGGCFVIMGTRALSGSKICKMTVTKAADIAYTLGLSGFDNGSPVAAAICIGSIKLA